MPLRIVLLIPPRNMKPANSFRIGVLPIFLKSVAKFKGNYYGRIEMWRTPVLGRLTSSVSVVSDFVANGYQTMQHVSTSPLQSRTARFTGSTCRQQPGMGSRKQIFINDIFSGMVWLSYQQILWISLHSIATHTRGLVA